MVESRPNGGKKNLKVERTNRDFRGAHHKRDRRQQMVGDHAPEERKNKLKKKRRNTKENQKGIQ